jgi:hypothetical protein
MDSITMLIAVLISFTYIVGLLASIYFYEIRYAFYNAFQNIKYKLKRVKYECGISKN